MKYIFEYFTLSDGRCTVSVEANTDEEAEAELRRTYRDVDAVISRRVEKTVKDSVWCQVCQDNIKFSEIQKVTYGSEWVHQVCPGCGNDLLDTYLPL